MFSRFPHGSHTQSNPARPSSSSSSSSSSRASVLKGDVVMLLADDEGHWLYVAPVDGDSCGFVPRARLEIASVSTSPSYAWQPWPCVTGAIFVCEMV